LEALELEQANLDLVGYQNSQHVAPAVSQRLDFSYSGLRTGLPSRCPHSRHRPRRELGARRRTTPPSGPSVSLGPAKPVAGNNPASRSRVLRELFVKPIGGHGITMSEHSHAGDPRRGDGVLGGASASRPTRHL